MTEQTPPMPTLLGPDSPGMRRLRQAVAAGKQIYPAPPGERSVVYLMGLEDNRTMNRRMYIRHPILFAGIALMVLIMVGMSFADAMHQLEKHSITRLESIQISYLVISTLLPVLGVVLLFGFINLVFPLVFKRQYDQIGPITVSLSSEGIFMKSRMAENRIYWQFIKDIERTTTHLFFWQSLWPAIVIPLWAFSMPEEATAFYNEAKQYHETAKQGGRG
jgi:hypothetical protein